MAPPSSASPTDVRGSLCLNFTRDPLTQRTLLKTLEQHPPLKVIRAFPLDEGATLVHLHNISGGILGGDQLALTVQLAEQTRVQLTTTSATRVYRSLAPLPDAQQSSHITIGSGALLEYLPDPLIPFAGARYRQETTIELGEDAGIFWWETLAPGRAATGERFAYTRVQIRTHITARDKPIAIERFTLEPQRREVTSLARLGPYSYIASFYICRVGLEASQWTQLEQTLNAHARQLDQSGEAIWGVSTLPAHGLVVRGLSRQGRALPATLLSFWQIAKQALYGQQAMPPRKVY